MAGINMAASTPMIAITTRSSINVKPVEPARIFLSADKIMILFSLPGRRLSAPVNRYSSKVTISNY
jgi:hypothetical protein